MPSFAAELHALDDPAAAHHEHLDDGAGRAQLQAEHVAVAQPAVAIFCWRSRSVCTVRAASRSCAASSNRSAVGGLEHRARQPLDQLVVLAFEEQLRVLHRHVVLLLRADRGDARRDAALDVVLEARPLAVAGDDLVARPDAEQPVRQRHRPARERRRHERAGVEAAVALDAARDQHARKRLVRRQLQVRIVLVVAQQDVVLRRALLDEVVLERERLDDRVGDDHLEAGDLVEQRVGLRMQSARAEIAAHAVAQRPRLADVDRVALPRSRTDTPRAARAGGRSGS